MVEIELSEAELAFAAQVGLRRHLEAIKIGLADKHGFNGQNGWTIHIEGAAGECAAAKCLGRFWNGSFNTFHNGGDVGQIQVRTRSESNYDLIVRENDRDGDVFILVIGRAPFFKIIGWIRGRDAKKKEWEQDYGGRPPAYFVPQEALHPIQKRIVRTRDIPA